MLATILPLSAQTQSYVLDTFNVHQGGADFIPRLVVNNSAIGDVISLGAILNTPVTGIVDPTPTTAAFDPNASMTLSMTPVVPYSSPSPLSVTIPAYDPSQYDQPPGTGDIDLNQRPISGTWYNPQTHGQGFVIEVSPDYYGSGIGLLFGGWYTYDVHAGDEQRWYTLQGQVSSDSTSATIGVYLTQGGQFDAAGTTPPLRLSSASPS